MIGVGSAAGHGGGDGNADGRFGVRGREIRRERIRPEEVEVTVRKSSPDLKKRYGKNKATISRTETYDRPKPEEDDLPTQETRTTTAPWEAEIATEAEWREAFTDSESRSVGEASVSTTDHSYREDYYDFGLFEYEKTDGLFERTAPMNVISPESLSGVVGVLDSNGYTTYVVQYDRYAWDSDQYTFRTQDRSAATGTFGFLGRKHVKFWEFGGYVSGSAHVDSSVPHEAVSFEDAEQHIEGKFDGASGWYGYDDYYDVDNGSFLDHDGSSTGLFSY